MKTTHTDPRLDPRYVGSVTDEYVPEREVPARPVSVVDTIRALMGDASDLVSNEVQLAKAEASEKVGQVGLGVAELVGAAVIALTALIVLTQALVIALVNLFDSVPPSLVSLGVGLLLAIVAGITAKAGMNALSAENLAPTRTVRSVRHTAETLKEAA